jgi:hypothetical protein
MSTQRWTHQTSTAIADCLQLREDIQVSPTTVRRLLRDLDYSLKSNRKCLSAGNSPSRDTQFGIIKQLREDFRRSGDPVISVDTKKKELIGLFKNPGRRWCREPVKVKDHDFRSEAVGIASPYGIYDLRRNHGVLVVGQSADTPEFATNSIALWWREHGQTHYPEARRLLVLADGGGSNAARSRAFKKFLQEKIADEFALILTVAHYPTGASKWNPIEHRMFSEITKNWAGVPLVSFQTLVDGARTTRTTTGLCIDAYRDEAVYEKGIKVSDQQMKKLHLTKSTDLGQWNYTITPAYLARLAQEQASQSQLRAA